MPRGSYFLKIGGEDERRGERKGERKKGGQGRERRKGEMEKRERETRLSLIEIFGYATDSDSQDICR